LVGGGNEKALFVLGVGLFMLKFDIELVIEPKVGFVIVCAGGAAQGFAATADDIFQFTVGWAGCVWYENIAWGWREEEL
jgi:hypothetical protein